VAKSPGHNSDPTVQNIETRYNELSNQLAPGSNHSGADSMEVDVAQASAGFSLLGRDSSQPVE
jgi:hypothetical protein